MVSPQAKRLAVEVLKQNHQMSERRACKLVGLQRTVARYKSQKRAEKELIEKIKKLAYARRRYGYRRIHLLLKRSGEKINHKRVWRLYREAGLKVAKRGGRKRAIGMRLVNAPATKTNQRWSLDFVADALSDGRRIRLLNVVDDFTRECLKIVIDTSLSGQRVARELSELMQEKGKPEEIISDNGTEFTSRAILEWSNDKKIAWKYIEPGKPTQNAYIESFNGKLRDECLNENWFMNLKEARKIVEEWRIDYNCNRPHSSLHGLTPWEFLKKETSLQQERIAVGN